MFEKKVDDLKMLFNIIGPSLLFEFSKNFTSAAYRVTMRRR